MKFAKNRIDITGQKFGKLTVIGAAPSVRSGKHIYACWLCECECGTRKIIRGERLKNGQTCSCGCSRNDFRRDIKGKRFGMLVAIERASKDHNRGFKWRCKCDCGEEVIVRPTYLDSGHTVSCGCYNQLQRQKPKKHGATMNGKPTKEYHSWVGLKSRCSNPNMIEYRNYGGRGIVVCERWLDKDKGFENFLEDMGECPDGFSLDRIDVNGNYEPENCRWATVEEQCNNKRTTHKIEFNGKNLSIAQWASELGIKYGTLWGRLHSPLWTVEEALTSPVKAA